MKEKKTISELREDLRRLMFALGEAEFALLLLATGAALLGSREIAVHISLLCVIGAVLMGLIVFEIDPLLVRILKKQRPAGTPLTGYPGAVTSWV
jgi:hypothetical protein